MLIVGQQAIAIVTVAMIEVVDRALQISGVVMFKQRDAEGFLRTKVVVEGALGHLRRLQKFAQAHSGKTAMHAKLLAGGRDMFSGIAIAVSVHAAHCSRPIGLMQASAEKC